jgi:hypothetical protein
MAKSLPTSLQRKIRAAVFARADEYGYAARGRLENGAFMDELIEDPEIGGVLSEYMEGPKIRTYIKDGVLNAYTKKKNKEIQCQHTPSAIVKKMYGKEASKIDEHGNICVCCSAGKDIFIISEGTVLKWETALRKALEYTARLPEATRSANNIHICIKLAVINQELTSGDKKLIRSALSLVDASVYFCS